MFQRASQCVNRALLGFVDVPLRVLSVMVCGVVLVTSGCQSSAPGQVATDNASISAPTDSSSGTSSTSPARAATPDQPPNAISTAPSPTAAPTPRAASPSAATPTLATTAAAPSAGAQSRVELLNMADAAYASKNLARAQTLYRRVITSSADGSES